VQGLLSLFATLVRETKNLDNRGLDRARSSTYIIQQIDKREVPLPFHSGGEEMPKRQVGNGIVKQSARPIEIHVDSQGEYWICDKGVAPGISDFRSAGCAPHSEVHLVK
jgi:hypothetical protein